MTNDEAKRHLEAARLMMLRPDGQPVSELYDALGVAIEALDAGPAHGKWIFDGKFLDLHKFYCSNCKRTEFRMSGYCPNCGARMDGKENADADS